MTEQDREYLKKRFDEFEAVILTALSEVSPALALKVYKKLGELRKDNY